MRLFLRQNNLPFFVCCVLSFVFKYFERKYNSVKQFDYIAMNQPDKTTTTTTKSATQIITDKGENEKKKK